MTTDERGEVIPIEETVKRIAQDFRFRRMRFMVDHPESVMSDDSVPDDLSQHAEASAIVKAVLAARPTHWRPLPAPPLIAEERDPK